MSKIEHLTEETLSAALSRPGVRSIPTLMVVVDGEPVAAQAGVIPAEDLVDALDRIARTLAPSAKAAA